MWETHWLGLAAYAFAMTVVYLVVQPEERIYATAGTGAVAWLMVALTAPGVERMTESGAIVDVPAGLIVQLFAAILGALSLLVVFLYRAGLYPPPNDDLPDDDSIKA